MGSQPAVGLSKESHRSRKPGGGRSGRYWLGSHRGGKGRVTVPRNIHARAKDRQIDTPHESCGGRQKCPNPLAQEPLRLSLTALVIVLHQCLRWESSCLRPLESAVVDYTSLIDVHLPEGGPVVSGEVIGTQILVAQHLRDRRLRIQRHVLSAFSTGEIPAPRSAVRVDPKRHVVGRRSICDSRPWCDGGSCPTRHTGFDPIVPRL